MKSVCASGGGGKRLENDGAVDCHFTTSRSTRQVISPNLTPDEALYSKSPSLCPCSTSSRVHLHRGRLGRHPTVTVLGARRKPRTAVEEEIPRDPGDVGQDRLEAVLDGKENIWNALKSRRFKKTATRSSGMVVLRAAMAFQTVTI